METGNETLAEGQPADDKLVTKLRFVMPQSAKLRFARSSRGMKRSFMDWGVAKRSLATSGEREFGVQRGRWFPGFLRKLATLAALASFGWTVPREAQAGFYQDGTPSQQTLDFGAAYQGDALSFRISVPGVGTGERNTSATFLNSGFALTSAHNITDLLQFNPTYEVADGSNFLTDRGNVMVISNIILHPSLDLAILQFSQPFYASEDKAIGVAVTGDTTYSAGFGRFGTPSTGLPPQDGSLRAWDARVQSIAIGGSAPYHQTTSFGNNSSGLTLNGRGASGDSGGPVFNAQGELIGITDSGSTFLASVGTTTYVRLGDPSTKAWIEANASVPEPSALTYGLLGAAGLLSRRQRRGCSRSFQS